MDRNSAAGGGGVVVGARAGWVVAVVVLVALLGGLSAVLASSARADTHTGAITVDCDGWAIRLSNYSSGSAITVTVDGAVVVDDVEFDGSYTTSGTWNQMVEHTIVFDVSDPEDSDGSEGWTFEREVTSPACDEPAIVVIVPTAATPTTVAPTSSFVDDTTVACDGIDVVLSDPRENPPLILVTIQVSVGGPPTQITGSFVGSYVRSVPLDPNVEQTIVVTAQDADPAAYTRTWISPVCEEPATTTASTATTAPTTTAPTTTTTTTPTTAPPTTTPPTTAPATPTTPTTATTTSVAVVGATLPFTGAGPAEPALLGFVLFGSGVLVFLFARGAED